MLPLLTPPRDGMRGVGVVGADPVAGGGGPAIGVGGWWVVANAGCSQFPLLTS